MTLKNPATYMMSNTKHGTIYVGMTAHFPLRPFQHSTQRGSSFCRKYSLTKLVWYEKFDLIVNAIECEKQLKAGSRKHKIRLIDAMNPDWNDLLLTIHH